MNERRRIMMQKHGGGNPWEAYIQDGLVFQLDCDTECSAELWSDIKGGYDFSGSGISLINGVPYFNGDAYYFNDILEGFNVNTHTLEIALSPGANIANSIIFVSKGSAAIGITAWAGKLIMGVDGGSPKIDNPTIDASFHAISFANKKAIIDGSLSQQTSVDSWGKSYATHNTTIGRYNNNYKYVGSICAVRVYDRHLTEDEMKSNQAIDLARFGSR